MTNAQQITADNFSDFLPLDYACSLASGVSNIDSATSAIVGRLVEWTSERGYEISRRDAAGVLWSIVEQETAAGTSNDE